MTYKVPRTEILIKSPVIDFKSTGVTTIFTTSVEKFAVIDVYAVCVSSTSASGDSVYSMGWTGPDYTDYSNALSFIVLTPDYYSENGEQLTPSPLVPVSTQFKVNVSSSDSGTALTGYFIIRGFGI